MPGRTDRQTDRQTDRLSERERRRDRQTDRQTQRQRLRQRQSERERERERRERDYIGVCVWGGGDGWVGGCVCVLEREEIRERVMRIWPQ